MSSLLYLATDAIERIPAETERALAGCRVQFLDLSESGIQTQLPDDWTRIRDSDLFDPDAFRGDFLDFLEACPKQPILNNQSFDQLFRRRDGYSVWWTSVGAGRTPGSAPVKKLKKLWIFDRSVRGMSIERVMLHCSSGDLGVAIRLRCQAEGIAVEEIESEARESSRSDFKQIKWLLGQLGKLMLVPVKITCFAALVRFLSRGPRQTRPERRESVILFRPHLSRLVNQTAQGVEIPFWQFFLQVLDQQLPHVRRKFLLHPRLDNRSRWSLIPWLRTTGRRLLEDLDGAVPPSERYTGLLCWTTALPNQIAALIRYCRLEGSGEFRSTLTFAGADVSAIIVPRLKQAIENMAEWERQVGLLVTSLSKIDDLRAVIILAEFYQGSMKYIAAAKRLKIPVIGVQHGTIYPSHYVYTIPQGHIDGAPVPDFFAAYGEYDREIVSGLGAYPEDRVWVIGSPRMDYLVNDPPDRTKAREQLNLPVDKKIVLIATHTPRMYPWFFHVVNAVFEATRERDDCLVCVKTHPGDIGMMANYQESAKKAGNSSVQFYAEQFDKLLAACDVLISGSSTTVMEATLLGRATICANFSGEPDRYPYVAHGASLPARDSGQLSHSLDILLSNDATLERERRQRRHAFLSRHLGPTAEGRGASVLLEYVRPLITNESTEAVS